MMTGFNLALIAAASLAFVSQGRPQLPSPVTWMRDKEDPLLARSLKDFFKQVKEDNVAPAEGEDTPDIVKGKGK